MRNRFRPGFIHIRDGADAGQTSHADEFEVQASVYYREWGRVFYMSIASAVLFPDRLVSKHDDKSCCEEQINIRWGDTRQRTFPVVVIASNTNTRIITSCIPLSSLPHCR